MNPYSGRELKLKGGFLFLRGLYQASPELFLPKSKHLPTLHRLFNYTQPRKSLDAVGAGRALSFTLRCLHDG